jgi:hypothetical protein
MYIIVGEEDKQHPNYLIQNNSEYISIKFHQRGCEEVHEYVDIQEKLPYAPLNPNADTNIIVCQFFMGSIKSNPLYIKNVSTEVMIDNLDDNEIISKIPTGYRSERELHLKIFTDGLSKIIQFSDTEDFEPPESNNVEVSQLNLNLKEIGLSLISMHYSHLPHPYKNFGSCSVRYQKFFQI